MLGGQLRQQHFEMPDLILPDLQLLLVDLGEPEPRLDVAAFQGLSGSDMIS